jgi:hypothetical protein
MAQKLPPIAQARHADELLRRDVGGNQRAADDPPRQVSPGEEIVVRLLLAPRGKNADRGHDGEIDQKYDQVEVHRVFGRM